MEQDGKQELSLAPLPVLERFNRLDRLVQVLEEKHSTSGRHLSNPVMTVINETERDEQQNKTLSSALEEVGEKGTLMERLTILENRVLQLSLVMDERKSSRSSSSTTGGIVSAPVVTKDNTTPKIITKPSVANEEEGEKVNCSQIQETLPTQEEIKKCRKSGGRTKRKYKWNGWFRLRC